MVIDSFWRSARLGLAGVALLAPTLAGAQGAASSALDEEALARRVTEQVMEQLEQGDFLQEQIRLGIDGYVREQRRAQAQARAQRDQAAGQRAQNVRTVAPDRDHIFGNPDARISLIEYSDFECPFCKRFHKTAKQVVEHYDGKVNWVYRHFPLEFHNPLAQKMAEASECAGESGGNDAFWRYTDTLYERTRSNGKGFPMDGLVPLAVEQGLAESPFRECLDSGRFAARVQEDLDEGQSIGITGTPGNLVRDNVSGEVRVAAGAVPLEQLRGEIDQLLAKAR